jgi:hypothetical protein
VGNGNVDLQAPLARMWRDVYAKAGEVADARAQELLKYHVYVYPHGAGGGTGGGGGWVLIEDRTLATDGASPFFGGLPQTYRDLRFVVDGRAVGTGVASGRATMQVNGDTADSYRSTGHVVQSGGTTHAIDTAIAGSVNSDYFAIIGHVPGELATEAGATGLIDLVWYDYTLTDRYKRFFSVNSLTGASTSGGQTRHYGGEWRSTAAISAVNLYPPSGDGWKAGTRIRCYGWSDTAAGGGGGTTDVTITTDASLVVTEAPANTFAMSARISADAGNALSLHANGLFATDTTGGGGTGNTTMYTQTTSPAGATNSLWFNPSEAA